MRLYSTRKQPEIQSVLGVYKEMLVGSHSRTQLYVMSIDYGQKVSKQDTCWYENLKQAVKSSLDAAGSKWRLTKPTEVST